MGRFKPEPTDYAPSPFYSAAWLTPPAEPAGSSYKLTRPDRSVFAVTIPPGSIKRIGGLFIFVGVINGVRLEALITPTGTLR
jgi:hypothetical protein